jgi:hypothetical protein
MRTSSLGLAAVMALGICATTSAEAALTVTSPVGDSPNIVLAACAPGWFRGAGRLCRRIDQGFVEALRVEAKGRYATR